MKKTCFSNFLTERPLVCICLLIFFSFIVNCLFISLLNISIFNFNQYKDFLDTLNSIGAWIGGIIGIYVLYLIYSTLKLQKESFTIEYEDRIIKQFCRLTNKEEQLIKYKNSIQLYDTYKSFYTYIRFYDVKKIRKKIKDLIINWIGDKLTYYEDIKNENIDNGKNDELLYTKMSEYYSQLKVEFSLDNPVLMESFKQSYKENLEKQNIELDKISNLLKDIINIFK